MNKRLALIIVIAVLCLGTFTIVQLNKTDVYGSSRGFEEFAYKSLNEREIFRANKNTTVEFKYNAILSVAVKKDKKSGKAISKFRDEKVHEAENRFLYKIVEDRNEDLKHACVIDTSIKRNGTGAKSLILYQKLYEESNDEMKLVGSSVKTYLFDEKSGKGIDPLQALIINYEVPASKYAKEYFIKTFGKDKLNEDWKEYITPTDDNYNDFIMTGKSMVFYFQPGTVLDESYGVVPVKIPQTVMQSFVRPRILDRVIDPRKPMVAITYDDGPGGDSEERILDCLEEHDCVATFFYQGYRIKKYGYNAVRAREIGCEIGNHSWDHPLFSSLTKKEMKSQLSKTNKKIQDKTGVTPQLFRPPYGDYNKTVSSAAKSKGMSEVLWTLDTRDWESRNYKKIFKSVKKSKKLDGKIILMHSIYMDTAKATEKIIPWLEEQGYQTVTVSELIKYKTGKTLQPGKVYRTLH